MVKREERDIGILFVSFIPKSVRADYTNQQ